MRCAPWPRWPPPRRPARGRRWPRLAGRPWRGGWRRPVPVLPRRLPRRARTAAGAGAAGPSGRRGARPTRTHTVPARPARGPARQPGIRPVTAAMARAAIHSATVPSNRTTLRCSLMPPATTCAQPDQGRQVEHVGAQDHAGADIVLAVCQRGHRRGDFRGVRRQRRDQAQERFRQAEPGAHPFQPDDQDRAGAQAERGGRHEHGHRPGRGHHRVPGGGLMDPAGAVTPRGSAAARRHETHLCRRGTPGWFVRTRSARPGWHRTRVRPDRPA